MANLKEQLARKLSTLDVPTTEQRMSQQPNKQQNRRQKSWPKTPT